MSVVAFVPDLMDRSKIAAAAPGTRFVGSTAELLAATSAAVAPVDLVVVDLGRPGVADALRLINGRIIGFASHVDRELIDSAAAAGCEAMPRSAFFFRLPALLNGPPGV